ncbi:MAG: SIS domain-containing protein [Candidatus Ranarchaeia archaeon]
MVSPFVHDFEKQVITQADQLTLLTTRWDEIRFLANTIRGSFSKPFRIFTTGCGDSYHVAQLGVFMANYHANKDPHFSTLTASSAISAFQLHYYPVPYRSGSRILITVSASGETSQTVKAQTILGEQKWFTIAISNNPLSTLCDLANVSFSTNVDPGEFIHPVTTTSAAIWAVQSLVANLLSNNPRTPAYAEAYHAMQRIPLLIKDMLKDNVLSKSIQDAVSFVHRIITEKASSSTSPTRVVPVISGGPTQPLAHLIALKLGELAWIHAFGYNIEEYIHSPLLTANKTVPHIIVIPDEHVYTRARSLVNFLSSQKIPSVIIAPYNIPAITESDFSIRPKIRTFPSAYLAIPLLFIGHLFVLQIARLLPNPPQGWRYGVAHSNLISQT